MYILLYMCVCVCVCVRVCVCEPKPIKSDEHMQHGPQQQFDRVRGLNRVEPGCRAPGQRRK